MPVGNQTITFLDLFAGAGGLSEGFTAAGYQSVARVEMDPDSCNTLRTRECYHHLKSIGETEQYRAYLRGDISRAELYSMVPEELLDSVICETMSEETMPSVFSKIDASLQYRGVEKIDLILGGPPCQAYSNVGRSRKNMGGDPRNTLYKLYFRALERYRPQMFVFENVPGLLTAANGMYLEAIKDGFRGLGYDLRLKILNAADYGVPQNRRRVIIIGWKAGSGKSFPELPKTGPRCTVFDILEDLPPLEPGEEKSEYIGREISVALQEAGIRTEDDILTWHVARPNQERDREIYRLAIRTWDQEHKRLQYTDIPEHLATHHNRSSFLDRFKVVARDLPVSHTMVAHISKDGHYYIHPDLLQARSISVREAARIQSFPDNFYFEGSRTSAFRQIGNAVPPLMANAIARALWAQFGGEQNNE